MYKFDENNAKKQVVKWIQCYFEENGQNCKAIIGISGGKDSSIVAALLVEALGRGRVFGVLMPQGKQHDIDVSLELVKILEIPYTIINIGTTVEETYTALKNGNITLSESITINTPARIRMTVLYAVCAKLNGRVVNTGNLSEDYIGYSSKYGDGAGDFSPLARFTATEVKAIGRELGLQNKFIDKVPEDGLTGKSDEDNLGFSYDVLDKYLRYGICENAEIKEKINRLHKMNMHKLQLMPVCEIDEDFVEMSITGLAEKAVQVLKKNSLRVSFAESCTGGMLSGAITSITGSSDVLDMSIITYSNWAKVEYTDVTNEIIAEYSEVSEQVAILMASGIRKRSRSTVGIGITGFAGPSGGNDKNPVGTVYIALDMKNNNSKCKHFLFSGDRQCVRNKATVKTLKMIIDTFD